MQNDIFNLDLNSVDCAALNGLRTEFAQVEAPHRIFFILDCPTDADIKDNRAYSSTAGSVLKNLLNSVGISPLACAFGYVTGRPVKYKNQKDSKKSVAHNFPWTSPTVLNDLDQLRDDIKAFKPNLIVPLGDVPLWACGKRGESVTNWHGSLYENVTIGSCGEGFKHMGSYDPADVFRNYDWMPLLRLDLVRAREEGLSPELNLPVRHYDLHMSSFEIVDRLRGLPGGRPIALDIEGYVSWISCLSIATSASDAFIIPFGVFSPEEDRKIIEQLRITMAREDIPKILQNCIYDYFCLAWVYQIHLANIAFDTMLSGWEHYPELPKGLGTQTAIWTREPYYKFQRKIDHTVTHWKYCCTDSCVTFEIAQRHEKAFTKPAAKHFDFNMRLLPAINYIQLRGMRFDKEMAQDIFDRSKAKQAEIQLRININAGKAINVNSPKQVCAMLYKEKGFPKQHPKVAGRVDKTKTTSNIDALLEINRLFDDPLIRDLIAWRKCEKIQQTCAMPASPFDGRMRCSYNLVGTDTGRLNCQHSAEQSTILDPKGKLKHVGANLTTVTKKLRRLFRADEGYEFFQLDLAGADGWTVAAHSSRFGDPTMWDDYMSGIKPARVIAVMHRMGAEISKLSRDELAKLTKGFGSDHDTAENQMLYFTCKRVQHGSNYLLGPPTMSDQILKDSFKLTGNPLYVDPKTCAQLQKLYNLRYKGVAAWQSWVKQELQTKGKLGCASGHTRTFFGRRTAHETLRSATAHEPQANTTFVTNMALLKLWEDPLNRRSNGTLIVEPLHHVHDALCGQWKTEDREFAMERLGTYFSEPITIAHMKVRIPAEGAYGKSWEELDTPFSV
jgi:DNA polymerase I-like protein with 3'-5' exonuclease and polymerase domains/uracil-DNA glycosylase